MKLSQVRPYDQCGGAIAPQFYLIRFSLALFLPSAVNSTLGLSQMLGGSLALAEVMGGDTDAVKIAGDESPELLTTLFICSDCMLRGLNLLEISEKREGHEIHRT